MNTKKAKLFPSNEVQNTSYTIRKATMKDFDELFKFRMLSKKEELKYSAALKPLSKTKKYFKEYVKLDLTKRDRVVFVAVEDNKIVGAVLGKYFKPFVISKYSRKGYMSNLYVDKKYRRRGIGEKLTLKVMNWLRDNKVPYISVEIHQDNKPSQKLCKKLGFKNYTVKMVKEF